MPNVNDLYPSQYLKAHDLGGKAVKVAIRQVVIEKIGSDTKPVLYFRGKDKGMVLNKTNAFTISQAYGFDTEDWVGAEVEIFAAFVDFQGKQVEGLRIRLPNRRPASQDWQAPSGQPRRQAPADKGFDDNSEDPAPRQQRRQPAMAGSEAEPFDDEVPF